MLLFSSFHLFQCEVEVTHNMQEVVLYHCIGVQRCEELFCLVHYFLSLSYVLWPIHTVMARNENILEFIVSGSGGWCSVTSVHILVAVSVGLCHQQRNNRCEIELENSQR